MIVVDEMILKSCGPIQNKKDTYHEPTELAIPKGRSLQKMTELISVSPLGPKKQIASSCSYK
jgi:hypothetical protein